MDARQMESLLRNLDRRTERIEQILPTLATKEESQAAIAPLATKEELRAAIAPLATKEQLRAAIAPLATKKELRAAIAPLATKGELHAAIAPLATKAELRQEGERTRRHFDVVAESLRDDIRIVAQGQIALGRRVGDLRLELKQDITGLDKRVTRLEASKKHRRDVQ